MSWNVSRALVIAVAISTGALSACSSDTDDTQAQTANATERMKLLPSEDPAVEFLADVFEVQSVHDLETDLLARVYETGGGDPAVNGDHLMLNLSRAMDLSSTWDLDLNVLSVTKVSFLSGQNVVVIDVLEHDYDAELGDFVEGQESYRVSFYESGNGLASHVDVQAASGGNSQRVEASTAPEHAMLDALWAVRSEDNEDVLVRVYETGGGDPAVNGDYVYVNVTHIAPTTYTYDTGLNVAAVRELRFLQRGTFRIETDQDDYDVTTEDFVLKKRSFEFDYRMTNGELDRELILREVGEEPLP